PGEVAPAPIILRDLLTEGQVLAALEQAGPSCCPPPEIRAAAAQESGHAATGSGEIQRQR
ncbi:MAG: hypothetical protein ACKOCX_11545, partial [Planctomycetota bacterium]